MSVRDSEFEVPTWAAGLLVVLVGLSFLYGIVVMQSIRALLFLWLSVAGVALNLFVVYLLYRFVIAVEKIADNI